MPSPITGVTTYLPASTSPGPSGSNLQIPATATAGETAFLIASQNSGSATFTPPSGWSIVGTLQALNTSHRAICYSRTVTASGTGSPGSNVAWSWSANGHTTGMIVTCPGTLDTFTIATQTTQSTTLPIADITPGVDNANLIALVSGRSATSPASPAATFPSGWTEDADDFAAWGSGVVPAVAAAGRVLATTAGTTFTAPDGSWNLSTMTTATWTVTLAPPVTLIPPVGGWGVAV